jgi:hypothetical protein
MDRSELKERLTEFGAAVADRLTDDQQEWLSEFIRVGEYGVALEMIADWLSEDAAPMSPAERTEAELLANRLGNLDRVMGPLALCPDAQK